MPDATFAAPLVAGGAIGAILATADRNAIVTGMNTPSNLPWAGLARLGPDGSADPGFDADPVLGPANVPFFFNVAQRDGRIVTISSLTHFVGVARRRVARINNGPTTDYFAATNERVRWTRGGSAPELIWTIFERSDDGGATWSRLGPGQRVGTSAHWELGGLSLVGNFLLRAQGVYGVGLASSVIRSTPMVFGVAPLNELAAWRQWHFGTTANAGLAANTADPDGDGLSNLVEYALGLDPNRPNGSDALPQPQMVGGMLKLQFAGPANVTDIAYSAEWSSTLTGPWTPLPDLSLTPNHLFQVPIQGDPKMFLRIRITAP